VWSESVLHSVMEHAWSKAHAYKLKKLKSQVMATLFFCLMLHTRVYPKVSGLAAWSEIYK